jgi:hypothetical protein
MLEKRDKMNYTDLDEQELREQLHKMKRTLNTGGVVLVAILIVVVIIAAFFFGGYILNKKQPDLIAGESFIQDQPDDIIEAENHRVTIQSLKQIISPASELIATKYYYTNADTYEDFKDIKGFKLPFTTNKTIFTYDGWVGLGFDISKVSFEIDTEKQIIIVELPAITVVANNIDATSFQYYDVSKSVFNSTEMREVTDLIAELKTREQEKVMANDQLIQQAEKNAQSVISSFLKSSDLTKNYDVIFK